MIRETLPPNANPTQKILLYGNSILIASLASKLAQVEGWEVTRVEEGELGDLSGGGMIVFDTRDNGAPELLSRLHGVRCVALVGVDALTDTVTVQTGHAFTAHSIQDVLDVLKKAL